MKHRKRAKREPKQSQYKKKECPKCGRTLLLKKKLKCPLCDGTGNTKDSRRNRRHNALNENKKEVPNEQPNEVTNS
jgi:uncharacterized Zn finger protein (UPF0148 family)